VRWLRRRRREAPDARTDARAETPPQRASLEHAGARDAEISDAELAAWMLGDGTYVTDGATLFRVAHAMPDRSRGELLVELEDCRTLELILCSSRALANLHLATVTPAEVIRSG